MAIIVAVYLLGKLLYRLRDVVLLMLVGGFTALVLNPLVVALQRWRVPRRGLAVTIVTLWAALLFAGLAVAFGYPLVNSITHFANDLPAYVNKAEHGKGWIGHLVRKYHIESWVNKNSPKLVSYAESLSKPASISAKGRSRWWRRWLPSLRSCCCCFWRPRRCGGGSSPRCLRSAPEGIPPSAAK